MRESGFTFRRNNLAQPRNITLYINVIPPLKPLEGREFLGIGLLKLLKAPFRRIWSRLQEDISPVVFVPGRANLSKFAVVICFEALAAGERR